MRTQKWASTKYCIFVSSLLGAMVNEKKKHLNTRYIVKAWPKCGSYWYLAHIVLSSRRYIHIHTYIVYTLDPSVCMYFMCSHVLHWFVVYIHQTRCRGINKTKNMNGLFTFYFVYYIRGRRIASEFMQSNGGRFAIVWLWD